MLEPPNNKTHPTHIHLNPIPSGDEGLARIFSDDGTDPFALLAGRWLGRPPGEVTPEQRGHAKQLCYGLLYGMGPSRLAEEMGLT